MTQHDDLLYLGHMLDMARKARDLSAGIDWQAYETNETLQLALTRLVQIIGEAARHVSPEGRARLASVSWHRVVGMRHRLVHDYVNVDIAIVWQVVTLEIPPLIAALEAVVPPEPPE